MRLRATEQSSCTSMCCSVYVNKALYNIKLNAETHGTGTMTAVFQQCSGGESMIFQWGGGGGQRGSVHASPVNPPPPPPMVMRTQNSC